MVVGLQEVASEVLQPNLVEADSQQGIFLEVGQLRRQHRQAYLLEGDSSAYRFVIS